MTASNLDTSSTMCGFEPEPAAKARMSSSSHKPDRATHRVDRVPGLFSNRPNWDPPPPPTLSPTGECAPTSLVQGGAHSLAGEEVGCPNSDEGTDTGTLYMYFVGISLWPLNFSPVCLSVCLSVLYITSVNCADI